MFHLLQIQGYPNPPSDLPDSPSPSTRVGAPAAAQPEQKSSLALAPSSDGSTKISAGPVPPVGPQPATRPLVQQAARLPVSCQAPPVLEGVTATIPLQEDLKLADETKSTGKPHQTNNEENVSQQTSQLIYVPPEKPVRCCDICQAELQHP